MNQRACLDVDRLDLLEHVYLKHRFNINNASNKFRLCFFIKGPIETDVNNTFLKNPNRNAVIDVHEVPVNFLTFFEADRSHNTDRIFIVAEPLKLWCLDIEIWVGFPTEAIKIIEQMDHHLFKYDYLEFFELW
ncbi:MAG: hypothetical protein H7256_06100 [Bdellovibrio sp.]|nr:hypothetical protein [Bdellovibrio sp.]